MTLVGEWITANDLRTIGKPDVRIVRVPHPFIIHEVERVPIHRYVFTFCLGGLSALLLLGLVHAIRSWHREKDITKE